MKLNNNNSIFSSVLIVSLFVGVIVSVIFKHSNTTDFYQLEDSLEKVQKIQTLNSNLDKMILESRFHLLSHYDSFSSEMDKIDGLLKKLDQLLVEPNSSPDNPYKKNLELLKQAFLEKGKHIEMFKSKNSIYKNSEYYLPSLLDEIFKGKQINDKVVKDDIRKISHLLLSYLTNPMAEQKQKLLDLEQHIIDRGAVANKKKIKQTISHLDIVINVGFDLNKVIKQITETKVNNDLEQLSRMVSANLRQNEQKASFYYIALVLLCAILAGTVIRFFIKIKNAKEDLEEKVAERTKELTEAKEVSEQAVLAKSRFLATMSHEIRTPMNAVLSCTNLLLDNVRKPENIKLLKTIHSSGDMLLALINDILDFSKIESGKMELENEPYDLHDSLLEIVELLKSRSAEKDINLHYKIDESVPNWVKGDTTKLRQVLTNIIGNAIKFTKDKVEVKVASLENENGQHKVQFSITDNGIGMPEEARSKLFKDFSQVDASTTRKFGGTGLGLAICKGIVQMMGGEIWVESEVNRGSVFHFTIVAQETESGATKKKVANSDIDPNMAANHPLKILMAEDNSVNQMVGKKIIAKLGYRLDIVGNGLEAVKAVKHQDYDLILMDQHMPEMDGVEATVEIRKLDQKQPKIFALTASAFKEDKDRCLEAGMDGFLTKPIVINELVSAFKECEANSELDIQMNQPELIDKAELHEQFDGALDILGEVIQEFLQCLPQYMDNIRKAIETQDAKALEISAHTLKGSVANFKANEAVEAALKLELQGKKNNLEGAEENFEALAQYIERLKPELEQLRLPKSA